MKWTTCAALAFIVGGVVTAGAVANPTWAESIGVDVWNVPALHDHFEREKRVEHSLDERGHATLHRALRRTEMVENVISGQWSFAEAIDVNFELAKSSNESWQRLIGHFPGATDREKSAHQLVSHLRCANDPRGRELANRLYREIATMKFE